MDFAHQQSPYANSVTEWKASLLTLFSVPPSAITAGANQYDFFRSNRQKERNGVIHIHCFSLFISGERALTPALPLLLFSTNSFHSGIWCALLMSADTV